MASLEQKYPSYKDLIQAGKTQGLSDKEIEDSLRSAGVFPKQEDLSFIKALGENIGSEEGPIGKIPIIGRPLEILTNILDIPQDLATAALSGGPETFLQKFARGENPSEALGIKNPLAAFATDIVLDPLILFGAPGGLPIKGFLRAKKIAEAEDILKSTSKVASKGKKVIEAMPDLKDYPTAAEIAKEAPKRTIKIDEFTNATPKLNKKTFGKVAEAYINLAKNRKIKVYPTSMISLSRQMLKHINDGSLKLGEIAAEAGKSEEEALKSIITGLKGQGSDASHTLLELKALWKELRIYAKDAIKKGDPATEKLAKDILKKANKIAPESFFSNWYKLIINKIWRGSLTSQMSTLMRNAIMQGARVGLDVLQKSLDVIIQSIPGIKRTTQLEDVFETSLRLFSRNKKLTEAILGDNIKLKDTLFSNFVSDLELGKAGDKVNKIADAYVRGLNAGNMFQEKLFRNAVFQATLKQELRNAGMNLEEIIANQSFEKINKSILKKVIDNALEMTFAKSPKSKIAKSIIRAVNQIPGLSLAIPFPRFMMNSLKFFFDFSPFGALRLYSPAQMLKIVKGDTQVISRAILGSALLGTAFQIRDSKYAGARWYEIKLPSGKTIDARPFNPLAAYLFVAELAKRAKEGTLSQLRTKDIFMGILSTNARAGTGLFIVDSFLQGIVGLNSGEKFIKKISSFTGELTGGFFTPFQQITDIYKQFSSDARIIRDTRAKPFLGPILNRLPVLSQTLPPLEVATRAQPFIAQSPLLKQLTGLAIREKEKPTEKELARLGFSYREIAPLTGYNEADRLIKKHMGPLVERILDPFVQSPRYLRMKDGMKAYRLSQILKRIRAAARARAYRENPQLFKKIKLEKMPKRKRKMLEEL